MHVCFNSKWDISILCCCVCFCKLIPYSWIFLCLSAWFFLNIPDTSGWADFMSSSFLWWQYKVELYKSDRLWLQFKMVQFVDGFMYICIYWICSHAFFPCWFQVSKNIVYSKQILPPQYAACTWDYKKVLLQRKKKTEQKIWTNPQPSDKPPSVRAIYRLGSMGHASG